MEIKDWLKKVELLEGLTDTQFNSLGEISQVCVHQKEDKLFGVGEDAHNVFILLEGKVSIQVPLSSRPEMVSIVILNKLGQLIGWSGLMGPSYYTADAVCLEDSKFLKIKGEEFFKIMKSDKQASFAVLQGIISIISERLRNIQRIVLKTM